MASELAWPSLAGTFLQMTVAVGMIGGLAVADGGYFPTSWGWASVAFAWVAALSLAGGRRLHTAEWVFDGAFAALAAWICVSWVWSPIETQTWLEALRTLVLPLGLAAALLITPVSALRRFAGGLLGAISVVSLFALTTRLFPGRLGSFDPVAVYRLAAPIGYWNALGLFAALGAVLALATVARAMTAVGCALGAATLPVLATTLYFTFSRGAWVALAVGLVVAVLLDPRRLQLFAATGVAAPLPAAGVWLASRSDALTHQQAQLVQAAHDGHRLALILTALAVANAGVAIAFHVAGRRLALAPSVQRSLNVLFAAGAAAVIFVGLAVVGGPGKLAHRAHDAFSAPPTALNGNLNKRLFSFSGNGRSALYQAAWDDYKAHPLLGSGAGSYEQYWLQHRQQQMKVRDAHSLYIETLAEVGPIGLLLLLVALTTPLVMLPRARHHPLVPALAGAYVAFLVHAAVDWDWEVLAVTLTGLFCGAGILVAARSGEERPLSQRVRIGVIVAVIALMAVAFVGLVGNIELSRAGTAARAGHWQTAARDAQRAHSWAPWSSEPWQQLGEAQLGLGEQRAAHASFRKAIAKSSKDWSLWFDLARASTGKAQIAALAQAHRLNPLSPEIAEFEKELAVQGNIGIVEK